MRSFSTRFDPWRLAAVLALLWAAAATGSLLLARWIDRLEEPLPPLPAEPVYEEDELSLKQESFAELPGFEDDDLAAALPAFVRSCRRFAVFPDSAALEPAGLAGRFGDWRLACQAAEELAAAGSSVERSTLQQYFEEHFVPFKVLNHKSAVGLFTGYYVPELRGSRRRGGSYTVPLYRPPGDMITVDLGRFREDLHGRRVTGRLRGRTLEPYADRRQIDAGELAGRGLELAWVDDPVDAFFLQIQGSGNVRLAEGGILRVGYAGQNGHPYFAIGRELIDRGELAPGAVSMQSIRRWLAEHPDEAQEVLETNASYVFFRELEGEGPLGAEGVVLTPERSLAVDRRFLPLGVPLWLDAWAPRPSAEIPPGSDETDRRLRRLLVAQDTGGAIEGPVRGDVFWGTGEQAGDVAGRMKHRGRYWILLPRALVERRDAVLSSVRASESD